MRLARINKPLVYLNRFIILDENETYFFKKGFCFKQGKYFVKQTKNRVILLTSLWTRYNHANCKSTDK